MAKRLISVVNARRLAMISWFLFALAYLAFFLVDLRLDFTELQIPCSGADCNFLAISQAEATVLLSWGVSMRFYAWILIIFTVLCVLVSSLLGGLVLWQQGSTRLGWSVSLALIVLPIAMISSSRSLIDIYPHLLLLSVLLSEIGLLITLLFFYLFPTGGIYPSWSAIPLTLTFLVFSLFNLADYGLFTLPGWASQIVQISLNGLILIAIGFQVLRYRRISTPLERQQTKWSLVGLFMLISSFPVWFLVFSGGMYFEAGEPRLLATMVAWIIIMLMMTSLPVTIAIAILRYRLWDIDIIIRRTLQYTLLTGLLALAYFGAVVLLQRVFSPLTGAYNSPLITVITTLGVAALFNPMRRWVQAFIDQRFYRQKYDAEQALQAFTSNLRQEVDLEEINRSLMAVTMETLQPENASLWLRDPGEVKS
jgi:hypothetical protein